MNKNYKINPIYNNRDYISKNKDWHAKDSPWKANQIKKIIQKNNLNIKTICEVGCGAGEIIKQLSLQSNYHHIIFFGYEMSSDAFELCKPRESERLKYFKEDLLEIEKKYDIILCIDVFEHIEDYMGFLRKLKNKGKYKIFHIPLDLSISSLIRERLIYNRKIVGHLHYFTAETALACLKDCGYEIIDTTYTPSFLASSSNTWATKLIKFPRYFLYKLSPKFLSKYLGGVSLLVLTK